MKYNKIKILKIVVWILTVFYFIFFITLSNDNKFSVKTDWFKRDTAVGNNILCGLLKFDSILSEEYEKECLPNNTGFPINIDSNASSGPFLLAWSINYFVALLVALTIGYLLLKNPRLYLILVYCFVLFLIINSTFK